jgi:hypothetical protein
MKKKSKLVILLFLMFSLMIFADFPVELVEAEPAKRAAGVKVGDIVKYGEFLSTWKSESSSATVPQELIDTNNTLSIINTVQSVSETTVTYKSETIYKNGTKKSGVAQIDVDTGEGNGTLTFVSAGLTAGDRVYTSGEVAAARINATLPLAYVGLTRQINFLNVTHTPGPLEQASYFMINQFYWDKMTGVMVEQFFGHQVWDELGYSTVSMVEYRMVDNNIWVGIPDSVAPVAKAGVDQTVDAGETVIFDAGDSTDDVGIARFLWDFGDSKSGEGISVTHVYTSAGVFNVTLTVFDAWGNEGVDNMFVTVKGGQGSSLFFGVPWAILGLVVFVGSFVVLLIVWVLLNDQRGQRGRRRRRR